jgi:hypothetical protein
MVPLLYINLLPYIGSCGESIHLYVTSWLSDLKSLQMNAKVHYYLAVVRICGTASVV